MQTQTLPKFKIGDRVIYRIKAARGIYDIRCQVLDVIYSEQNGYSYQLSELGDYLDTDIKPDENIRLDTISK